MWCASVQVADFMVHFPIMIWRSDFELFRQHIANTIVCSARAPGGSASESQPLR